MNNEIFFSTLTIPIDFTLFYISEKNKESVSIKWMIKENCKDCKRWGELMEKFRELSNKGFIIGYVENGEEIYKTIHLSISTIHRIYYEMYRDDML